MKYIIEGDSKVLENVLREQRIRIGRGTIKVSPASGLVPEEDVRKTFEEQRREIGFLKEERDRLMSRISELETNIAEKETKTTELETENGKVETKKVETEISDSKVLASADDKYIKVDDDKSVSEDDGKKPAKSKKELKE